jgi:hypothetical protein
MLGRLPTKDDARNLCAQDYLDLSRPRPPLDRSWSRYATGPIPKFKNDTEPCCVVSALAHSLRICSAAAGNQIVVSDDDIMRAYRKIEQPGGGAYCLDGLKLAKRDGIGGHRLLAYARINLHDTRADEALLATVEIAGSVYGGYDLPLSAQTQDVWAVPPEGPVGPGAPRSWGGHAMPITDQDLYSRYVQTWGYTQRMTSEFQRVYCPEAYLLIWEAWIASGRTPTGLDLDALLAAVETVT